MIKIVALLSLLIACVRVTISPAFAADKVWNAGTSDWNTGANWTPAGAPTGADNLTINNGGTAQVTAASADRTITLGATAATSGTITISAGGSLTDSTSAFSTIGGAGTGTMNITGGGQYISINPLTLGTSATGNGTLTIDGAGSQASAGITTIGSSGTGLLTITNGGVFSHSGALNVGFAAGSNGTVNVSGASSRINGTNNVFIGASGTGTLSVTGGAVVSTIGNLVSSSFAAGSSTITVDGAGSSLQANYFIFGGAGNSTVNITNSGQAISLTTITIGSGSTVTVDGAGSLLQGTGNIGLGGSAGGTSTLNVINGASLTGGNMRMGTLASQNSVFNIGNGGAVGTINVPAIIGGVGTSTVNLNHNDPGFILSASMTGNLNLNQQGTGTSILTAENTFRGTTTISNGTLQLGNGGATGNLLNSNIVDNSHLVYNRSGTTLVNGIISGTGDVSLIGPGTVILANDNTYAGGTTITAGTLQLGNGGATGSVTGNITDNGTLAFNHSDFFQYNGLISGTGAVIQSKGITYLTQAQTYTGATTINDGQLLAGATNLVSTSSGVTVNGGIFSANGFNQQFANLLNNGVVNLFGPATQLNITGNLSGGGLFGMSSNIEANTSGHITVQGASTGAHKLAILNTGAAPADLTRTLELVSTTDSSAGGAAFSTAGDGVDVGIYSYSLQRGNGTARMPDANAWYLALNVAETSEAARAIIGTAAAMSQTWFTQMDNLHRRMGQQRLVPPEEHTYEVWSRSYARANEMDASVTGRAFNERILGTDFGIDAVLDASQGGTWLAGAFFGYGMTERHFNDYGSKGTTHTPYGGLYATWFTRDNYYVDMTAKMQHFNNDFDAFDASGNEHLGAYTNLGLGGSVEVGKRFFFGENGWTIQPQLQAGWVHIFGEDYVTARNTAVKGKSDDIFQFRGGLEGGKYFKGENSELWYPYARVSVVEQINDGGGLQTDNLSWSPNLNGTSYEAGIGLIHQWNFDKQGYITVMTGVGDHVDQPWGINLGFRYAF